MSKILIKYELVTGRYEGRDKKIHDYETLKLYTMTILEDSLIWHPTVDPESQYEQTTACGGFRERTRRWVKRDDISEKATGCNVPVFESFAVKPDRLEELLGIKTMAEFESIFVDELFLHPISVEGMLNDYGRLDIKKINISPDTVLDLIKKKPETPVN